VLFCWYSEHVSHVNILQQGQFDFQVTSDVTADDTVLYECERAVCSYCAKFEVKETRPACGRHEWTGRLRAGTVVCVECQQFVALRASVNAAPARRCAGHGVYQRQTAWNAVGVRRCHGKWTLISRHVKPCQCDPRANTSFVFV